MDSELGLGPGVPGSIPSFEKKAPSSVLNPVIT